MNSYQIQVQHLEATPDLFISLICHGIPEQRTGIIKLLSVTCPGTFVPLKEGFQKWLIVKQQMQNIC